MTFLIGSILILLCIIRTTAYIIYTVKNNNKTGAISLGILLLVSVVLSALYII